MEVDDNEGGGITGGGAGVPRHARAANTEGLLCRGDNDIPQGKVSLIRRKRIYFSKHFCCCFASNLYDLIGTNLD